MAKCSYLGLKRDPKTALGFSSDWNVCHHAMPIASPSPDHQEAYCLSSKHKTCPVFLLAEKKPLPKTVTVVETQQSLRENDIFRYVGIVLLLLAGILVGALVILGNQTPVIAEREGTNQGIFTTRTGLAIVSSITPTISSPTAESTATETLRSDSDFCVPPDGWILYTLKPVDSMVRLSVIFRISIANLQSANCLGIDKILRPGDQIYVPISAVLENQALTLTATFKPTPTSSPKPRPYFPPTPTKEDKPKPPPPPPPTNTPPLPSDTPVPVVPTSPPEPATPTSPPPPTP